MDFEEIKFKEIKKEWFLGRESGYSSQEVVEGFRTVDQVLGEFFLKKKWAGQRGIAVANPIVEFGLNLKSILNIKGFDKIKERLLNKSTYSIAVSELAASAYFAGYGILTELYPVNPDKDGELDMKLRAKNGENIFVEVASPRTQIWKEFLLEITKTISKIAKNTQNTRLEIYIYNILNEEQIKKMLSNCEKIIAEGKTDAEKHIKNECSIFLSNINETKINSVREKETEEQTDFFMANISQKDGYKNIVTVAVPFTDKRAEEIIKREYHQMTSDHPNILVLDLSGVPRGIENWQNYIKRRLQPKINRKISAVMIQSGVNSEKINYERKWTLNPYAFHKVKQDIIGDIQGLLF